MIRPPARHQAIDAAKLRRGRGRAGVAWVVIAALLGLLFMPLHGGAGVTLVTVCTEDGGKQIALDAKGSSVPLHKQQADQDGSCPFCTGHAGYSLPPPPLAVVLPVPRVLSGRALGSVFAADVLPRPHFLTGRPSRAPPTLAA